MSDTLHARVWKQVIQTHRNGQYVVNPNTGKVNYVKVPIGVVAAKKLPDGKVAFGWSLTNKRDVFNHQQGIQIAIGRCFNGSNKQVPSQLSAAMEKMSKRAIAYFKA